MDFNPFSLEGKNIIITGASSGLGRQCAIDCSRMGARIVAIGRNTERLQGTMGQLAGTNHVSYLFDLTDFEGMSSLVSNIAQDIGRIDGLVNCAGISNTLPLKMFTKEKLDDFFQTNVYSSILLSKEICRSSRINPLGGSIIFLSSVMGCVGDIGKALYGMTKGALLSAAHSLACEYAPRNIRFNCISPGVIRTPINENQPYMLDKDLREKIEKKHLLGFGKPSDISSAAIYLLSDASRWITGQNLIVDGGYTIR